jgi:hypothetical protein
MFSLWEEGGTLAWGQDPGPDGTIPVRLFIDGRAQGAFPAPATSEYLLVLQGGPIGDKALSQGHNPGEREVEAMAYWVDRRLRSHEIWLAMIAEDTAPELRHALMARPNWKVVLLAERYVLLADVSDPRGRSLYDGVLAGTARFPEPSVAELTTSWTLLTSTSAVEARRGLAAARRSFELRPTSLAVRTARRADRFPELRGQLASWCETLVRDWQENKERYLARDGVLERTAATIVAAEYLLEAGGGSLGAPWLNGALTRLREVRKAEWDRSAW